MKKNNEKDPVFKTSIVCEGEMDRSFIFFLKVNLYKSKQPVCKTHSEIINGTMKLDNVKVNKNKCCKTFYFFDKDEWENSSIKRIKDKIEEQGDTLILSNPQIELCLLAIFEKHCDTQLDKEKLEKKITNHINKNNIYSSKYLHNLVVLEKILLHLINIINDEKNDYTLEKFEENLNHYNSHEKLYTNLIEYINHLTMKRES